MNRLFVDLFQAYYDARRNKRNKHTSLQFEIAYESHLMELYEDLAERKYIPGKSTCFIIHDPVQREVFAADFRDRIVHHLIYNYMYDIFDTRFINDSYSCRIAKGTHYGIKRIDHFIRSCSDNYTKDTYVLKLDIKGFFMSIDKQTLWNLIQDRLKKKKDMLRIDYERLCRLIQRVLFHNSITDVILQSDKGDWKGLPLDKSLFFSKPGTGLAIGNLTSQLFANIYLHPLDQFIKRTLHCKYYGRYVDDFILIHEDKEYLKNCIPKIKDFLSNKLGLTLHPKKIYLQHYTKGVKFLGAYIKPHRIYINRRTVGNLKQKIKNFKPGDNIEHMKQGINSYFGMLQHYTSYMLRKKIANSLPKECKKYMYVSKSYSVIKPRQRKLKLKEVRALISQYKHIYHALSRTTRI